MKDAEEAKKMISGLNNTPMDRSHTFHVYSYSDIVDVLENKEEVPIGKREDYPPLEKVSSEVYLLYLFFSLE